MSQTDQDNNNNNNNDIEIQKLSHIMKDNYRMDKNTISTQNNPSSIPPYYFSSKIPSNDRKQKNKSKSSFQTYHINSMHKGFVSIPMYIDFFGEDQSPSKKYTTSLSSEPCRLSFYKDIPRSPGGMFNAQFGTYSIIQPMVNLGGSSTHFSIGSLVNDNVDLQCHLELGPQPKFSILPTFQIQSMDDGENKDDDLGTFVTCGISSYLKPSINNTVIPKSPMNVSFRVQKHIYRNNIFSDLFINMSTPLVSNWNDIHLSFTTLYPNIPKCTLQFHLGPQTFQDPQDPTRPISDITKTNALTISPPKQLPISFTATHPITSSSPQNQFGTIVFGWDPYHRQYHLETLITRITSKWNKISIGIRHFTHYGITWLWNYERGNIHFSIPITVTKQLDPTSTLISYSMKMVTMTALSTLIDGIIARMMEVLFFQITNNDQNNDYDIHRHQQEQQQKSRLQTEEQLLFLEKAIQDSKKQVMLMSKQANKKKRIEEEKNGLVILSAQYYGYMKDTTNVDDLEDQKMEVLDVVTQLQFWVVDSKLMLPASTKSNLLGFYDVTMKTNDDIKKTQSSTTGSTLFTRPYSWISFFKGMDFKIDNDIDRNESLCQAKLSVTYKIGGATYEKTIHDDEELNLPCKDAKLIQES